MKINMMQNKIAHTLLSHIVTQQYQFAFFVVVNVHSTLPRCRVFNKNSVSWQNLPAIFNVNLLPTFLGNYLSLSRVFMCFTELKKKKLMMSVFCSNTLIICAPEAKISKFFQKLHAFGACKLHLI